MAISRITLVRNPFASVARIIANGKPTGWLEKALQELAPNVVTDIGNAKRTPLRSEIRANVKVLKEAAKRFESALNRVSLLDLPAVESKYLPEAHNAARSIISLCDKALSITPGKAGALKEPGRTICAMIIIEAWALARRGRAPSKNDLTAQGACDYYWRACEGPPTNKGENIDWSRAIAEARTLKDVPMRNFIHNEMQRYRMGT
jgi:hypothetical protein